MHFIYLPDSLPKPVNGFSLEILKSIYITQDTAITFTLPTASHREFSIRYRGTILWNSYVHIAKPHHPSISSSEDWGLMNQTTQ